MFELPEDILSEPTKHFCWPSAFNVGLNPMASTLSESAPGSSTENTTRERAGCGVVCRGRVGEDGWGGAGWVGWERMGWVGQDGLGGAG